jgi:alpha-D-ribose 1-methylphosphonate 5-triphosphate diphosphatase
MWFVDFRLVLPDRVVERGAVRVERGRIAEIVDGRVPHAEVYGGGLTLMPGLVDLHGDMLEREIEPRPKAVLPIDLAIHELDKRLVATGITTAFAAVSFHQHGTGEMRSEERARLIISTVNDLRPTLLTDLRIHARFEVTKRDAGPVLASLMDAKCVHLVSMTDHTPGQGQYRDIEQFVKYQMEWRRLKKGVEESEEEIRARIAQQQEQPKSWDVVRAVASLAKERHIPLASHDDDSPEKVEFVAGLGATISEFPITLESARAARARGMRTIMGAPNALLGRSNTNNLSAIDAIRAGVVDVLAADYHPASMLQSVCNLAARGVVPLHEGIRMVSLNAAQAAGLTDRGSIEIGKLADLTLVEMGDRPRVRATFRAGKAVYADGSVDVTPYKQRPELGANRPEALTAS